MTDKKIMEILIRYGYHDAAHRLAELQTKLRAAEACIYDIEDALNHGNDNQWARDAIEKWEEGYYDA